MAKKASTAVAEANPRTSGTLTFDDKDTAAAHSLGIVLTGTLEDRISRAVYSYNAASRLAVEAGYLLLSVKAEVDHGQFDDGIKALGWTSQRASELMRMAKFATELPEERRAEMLQLPKSKVLALATADSSVIQDLLESNDGTDLDDLTVRGLRDKIKELQAATTDLAVQRDKAEADKKAAEKKLKRAARDEDEAYVPIVIADIRAEAAALLKKAELAITALHPLGVEAVNLAEHDEASQWVQPSLRLTMSGLLALRVQIDGTIKSYVEAMGENAQRLKAQPDALAFLDETEIKCIAEDWARLTATHQHEAALRAHERDQAKPKGKGRPAKAPEAPKAAKA